MKGVLYFMARQVLSQMVVEAYRKYGQVISYPKVIEEKGFFTVILDSEMPFIGENFFLMTSELEQEFKSHGYDVKPKWFYSNLVITLRSP